MKKIVGIILSMVLGASLAGCSTTEAGSQGLTTEALTQVVETVATETALSDGVQGTTSEGSSVNVSSEFGDTLLETAEMFTDRDLAQEVDLTDAVTIDLVSHEDVVIDTEGVYVLSGTVEEVTVIVAVEDEAKVQLALNGVSITNESSPAIYVKSGDKIFVTTISADNFMTTTGYFEADGETNTDAVIFSKSDLVLNGTGSLEIVSTTGNGITSKDDLKITGGNLAVTANADAIEANDSIRIYDGAITIVTNKDGLHSENDDDTSLGYIYIKNGTINISSADDAIRGTSLVQIDGGDINIETCTEGIEGTYIQINGGDIDIYATDDGINAANKSAYDVMIELNGGTIDISMASGDTDAIDANGDIVINGGTITLVCGSSFDADGTTTYNGGEVVVNGEVVTDFSSLSSGGRGDKKR